MGLRFGGGSWHGEFFGRVAGSGAGAYAGTSIASAFTARALALYLTRHPGATRQEALAALRTSLTDRGTAGKDAQYAMARWKRSDEEITEPIASKRNTSCFQINGCMGKVVLLLLGLAAGVAGAEMLLRGISNDSRKRTPSSNCGN